MKITLITLLSLFLFAGCQRAIQYEINAPEIIHNRAVGASAVELLSGDKYKSLIVELQYMPGAEPDAAALESLKTFLATYCNKPNGISVVTSPITSDSKSAYTIGDITSIERNARKEYSGDGRIAVYLLYVNGSYTDNTVLGAAYQNTSAVIFTKTITDNSGGIGQTSRTKLEATVLQHEMGHLFGLVDTGSPMQTAHKDASHGSHCDNQNCLMYYASETTDALGFLITGNVPPLDDHCLADIKAQGSK